MLVRASHAGGFSDVADLSFCVKVTPRIYFLGGIFNHNDNNSLEKQGLTCSGILDNLNHIIPRSTAKVL